jgi:hypothetical protein
LPLLAAIARLWKSTSFRHSVGTCLPCVAVKQQTPQRCECSNPFCKCSMCSNHVAREMGLLIAQSFSPPIARASPTPARTPVPECRRADAHCRQTAALLRSSPWPLQSLLRCWRTSCTRCARPRFLA